MEEVKQAGGVRQRSFRRVSTPPRALEAAVRPVADLPVDDEDPNSEFVLGELLVCCEAGPVARVWTGGGVQRFCFRSDNLTARLVTWQDELEEALEQWQRWAGATRFSAWWIPRGGRPPPKFLSSAVAPSLALRLDLERAALRASMRGGAWDATLLAVERRRSNAHETRASFVAPLLASSPQVSRGAVLAWGLAAALPILLRADTESRSFWKKLSPTQLRELPTNDACRYVDVRWSDRVLLRWPRATLPRHLGALLAASCAAANCTGTLLFSNGVRYSSDRPRMPGKMPDGPMDFLAAPTL